MALSTEGQEGILQRVVCVEHMSVSNFCVGKQRDEGWHDYFSVKNDFT